MVLQLRQCGWIRRIFLTASLALTASFGVLALPASAAQTVPYKVNFQGRLTDNNGNILADGTYNVKFRLFDADPGGTNKWEEDRVFGASDKRITVQNGLFNIQFGDVTPLTPALFSGAFPLYLEVELPTPATATCASNGCASFTEGPMTPRQPLASSPYSLNSDTLDGIDSTGFAQINPAAAQSGSLNLQNDITAGGKVYTTALDAVTAAILALGPANATGITLGKAGVAVTAAGGINSPSLDAVTATILALGPANATGITLGKTGVQVSAPGGITTSNSNIDAGTGTITSGAVNGQTISSVATFTGTVSAASGFKVNNVAAATGTFLRGNGTNFVGSALQATDIPGGSGNYVQINPGSQETGNFNIGGSGTVGTSVLSPLLDVASAGSLNLGTGTATSITLGKFGVITTTAGSINVNSGTNIPASDQLVVDNTGSAGVTTANVNGAYIKYKGGAGAIESAGLRVDYTSGGTSGSTWSGMRIVESNAVATGVTSYGLKLEGNSSANGKNVAIKIGAGWDTGLEIASGSSDPATPAAGNLDIYARTVAGRSLLRQKSSSGVSFSYQPGLFEQSLLYESPGAAGAISTIGGALTASGNITNPAATEVIGSATNFATANNNTTAVGIIETTNGSHFRGSTTNASNGFFYVSRIGLPDATFNTTARTFVGLTDGAAVGTMVASDAPAGNFVGFRYSTTAADTSWKFITRDGTTAAAAVATLAATSGHVYDFYLYSPTYTGAASIANLYWRVDDLTAGTTTEGSAASNLPTATVALKINTTIAPSAAGTVHNLRVLKHYVETDR